MSALDQLFVRLRTSGQKAFMPFVTAGDPNLATTTAIIRALEKCGASACEVGVPYSDPIADGPVIQASYQRALDGGFRLSQLFDLGTALTPTMTMPLVTMVSYSMIHRIGRERYVDQALAAGYSGAIVPDLLVEEAGPLAEICRRNDFSLVQLVTPTTPRSRQVQIAELSTGFLYVVSVTGITGERLVVPPQLIDNVGWLREQTSLPICIGFGISDAETARRMAAVCDGVIVGSAIVRRIAESGDLETAVKRTTEFAKSIIDALSTKP